MAETHGTVFWTELMTRDLEAAKRYYGALCGWTFQTMPMGPGNPDYTLGLLGERPVVGMMDLASETDDPKAKPYWMSYLAVDDVDAAAAATEKAGGKILNPPFDIPNTGRIAVVQDPTGARIGLMTPEPM